MNQQQQTIPLQLAFQIAEKVLIDMKKWLETQKNLGEGLNGYEFDSHPAKTAEAIKSTHHARMLLPVYLRHLIQQSQQGLKK